MPDHLFYLLFCIRNVIYRTRVLRKSIWLESFLILKTILCQCKSSCLFIHLVSVLRKWCCIANQVKICTRLFFLLHYKKVCSIHIFPCFYYSIMCPQKWFAFKFLPHLIKPFLWFLWPNIVIHVNVLKHLISPMHTLIYANLRIMKLCDCSLFLSFAIT